MLQSLSFHVQQWAIRCSMKASLHYHFIGNADSEAKLLQYSPGVCWNTFLLMNSDIVVGLFSLVLLTICQLIIILFSSLRSFDWCDEDYRMWTGEWYFQLKQYWLLQNSVSAAWEWNKLSSLPLCDCSFTKTALCSSLIYNDLKNGDQKCLLPS